MSKYNDLYNHIKKQINDGQIKTGAKLPSIRKAAALFSVSRTTVQNAYFALEADGYIISEPQSGYYVSYHAARPTAENAETEIRTPEFDFKSGGADNESFEFDVWRKYMKNALRHSERMLSYGEPQGEEDLRTVLADYIREKRNVAASPGRIVIGAGVQSLLGIFCSLIENRGTVSFPDKSFIQGAGLFSDYGFDVRYRYKDAEIIYVSPSHMNARGDIMPNKRRIELVNYSAQTGSLVIEDDYESDFQYNSVPVPSLYALAGGENVVYLGSFSKLLLPSIRISFMVLTDELAEKYKKNIRRYNQTAGKTEQIALCQYIRDGRLKAQIRKTRRFYTSKAKAFALLLSDEFKNADVEISENALQVILSLPFSKDPGIFQKAGIAVSVENFDGKNITLIFNTGAVGQKNFSSAIKALKSAIY